MKTNLALSTTVAAASTPRRAAPSVAQTTQRQTIQMLGQIWRSLSFQEKSTWLAAAQAINSDSASSTTVRPKTTAYLTFTQMGGALYATQGTVPRTASSPPVFPAPLANIYFAISGSGPNFSLNLSTPNGYPDRVIVRAAPPVPAGHTTFRKKAFKIIGTLPSLSTLTTLTDLFTAHYRNPGPGATIAIELVGVSTSGLRTSPLILTAVTFGPADTALTLE